GAWRAPGLPPEVCLTVVRTEIGADREIGIKRQEIPGTPIETRHDPVTAAGLQDLPPGHPVTERLGPAQVLPLGDLPELRPVLLEVFGQGGPVPEADLGVARRRRRLDRDRGRSRLGGCRGTPPPV